MTQEDKLKAVIEKVIGNGFRLSDGEKPEFEICLDRQQWLQVLWDNDYYDGCYDLLFDHDFAKAFWGKRWQHHLQQAVTREDSINYYYENI